MKQGGGIKDSVDGKELSGEAQDDDGRITSSGPLSNGSIFLILLVCAVLFGLVWGLLYNLYDVESVKKAADLKWGKYEWGYYLQKR